VTRRATDKMKDAGRVDAPFELVVETASGRERVLAAAVVDASGALTDHNPLGSAGVPAIGESDVSDRIAYGVPDVLSAPERYAGKRILVVGAGHSAMNVLQEPMERDPALARRVLERLSALRAAGFTVLADRYGVRLAGSQDEGYDPDECYPAEGQPLGRLVAGDLEFGVHDDNLGRKSYVSKLVSRQITKIINLTPLLNHNLAGVSGNLYGLAMASVDNTLRFVTDAETLAKAVPEIYALPLVGDRVVLNIVDALIAQYYGESHGLLHYAGALNQLRFSTDPVALDVLSIQELDRQRAAAQVTPVKVSLELYDIAALLEIGVADPRAIRVEIVP